MFCNICVKFTEKSKDCLDNLLKMIYNVKRLLCKAAFCAKLGALGLCFLALVPMLCINVGGSDGNEAEIKLSLSAEVNAEEGIVSVILGNPRKVGFCGLAVALSYNSDAMRLTSVKKSDLIGEAVGFDYEDLGGEIRLLIDCGENICCEELVIFSFVPNEDRFKDNGSFALSLFLKTSACALLGGEIMPVGVELPEDLCLSLHCPQNGVRALSVEKTLEDGESLTLTVTGRTELDCFAAGFDLFLVGVGAAHAESFSVSSVLPLSCEESRYFTNPASLPAKGMFFLTVRPFVYNCEGKKSGREIRFFLTDGELCEIYE